MEMGEGKRPFDYGMAELLAFASLVDGRHAGAADRAGLAARNVQPAALGADGYGDRGEVLPL